MKAPTKAELHDQIQELINERAVSADRIHALETRIQELLNEQAFLCGKVEKLQKECNEMISGVYWSETKNERGAGRKSLVTDERKREAIWHRSQGMSYREIAKQMGLSAGLVHRMCK